MRRNIFPSRGFKISSGCRRMTVVISAAEHSALAHLHRGVRLAAQADFEAELRRLVD